MTPHPANGGDNHAVSNYQEFEYPHVFPQDDLVASVGSDELAKLTPLERAFVDWLIRVDDPHEAVIRLMRPSRPFDTTVSNGYEIRLRPTVSDAVNKIRKKSPFLSRYTANYTLGVIHDEIEWLRARVRRARYDKDSMWVERMCNGKTSVHSEEIDDTKVLIELLKFAHQITTVQGADGSLLPAATPGEQNSGIDRVLALAEEQILRRHAGDARPSGGSTA